MYRARPFKKRKIQIGSADPCASSRYAAIFGAPSALLMVNLSSPSGREPSLAGFLTKSSHYPNPGYLGSSSHTAFFKHLSPAHLDRMDAASVPDRPERSPESLVNDGAISHGAELIKHFVCSSKVHSWIPLLHAWIEKGVNLALAESFTGRCAETTQHLTEKFADGSQNCMDLSRTLFRSSLSPLAVDASAAVEDFYAKFCGDNMRWETLGLFFTAVSRATIDLVVFEPLYSSQSQRRSFQELATYYSDSWRKLGDVTSSLFALGYHEQLDNKTPAPRFLQDLRQAAFARAYSADKNVALFLGRPPRILRKYSRVLPRHVSWDPEESYSLMADTRWSSLCAILKEDILDLSREENYDERIRKAREIQADAEVQWAALPQHFRLEGSLKTCDRRPVERDFLVSTRLNHLHVLFLLRLALVHRTSEPDARLLVISANMLNLVMEAVVLKDRLANSGTSLVWK
ncbi:hypothetical protein MPH_07604, partial [Macrophomina phaseolina MS6]